MGRARSTAVAAGLSAGLLAWPMAAWSSSEAKDRPSGERKVEVEAVARALGGAGGAHFYEVELTVPEGVAKDVRLAVSTEAADAVWTERPPNCVPVATGLSCSPGSVEGTVRLPRFGVRATGEPGRFTAAVSAANAGGTIVAADPSPETAPPVDPSASPSLSPGAVDAAPSVTPEAVDPTASPGADAVDPTALPGDAAAESGASPEAVADEAVQSRGPNADETPDARAAAPEVPSAAVDPDEWTGDMDVEFEDPEPGEPGRQDAEPPTPIPSAPPQAAPIPSELPRATAHAGPVHTPPVRPRPTRTQTAEEPAVPRIQGRPAQTPPVRPRPGKTETTKPAPGRHPAPAHGPRQPGPAKPGGQGTGVERPAGVASQGTGAQRPGGVAAQGTGVQEPWVAKPREVVPTPPPVVSVPRGLPGLAPPVEPARPVLPDLPEVGAAWPQVPPEVAAPQGPQAQVPGVVPGVVPDVRPEGMPGGLPELEPSGEATSAGGGLPVTPRVAPPAQALPSLTPAPSPSPLAVTPAPRMVEHAALSLKAEDAWAEPKEKSAWLTVLAIAVVGEVLLLWCTIAVGVWRRRLTVNSGYPLRRQRRR
ncbi:hypothetical protein [Actinocorallia sp. A-T 12471]|uniref:hypothetical protein n=1 Tax=Actinocorallia sp. A-T 12471 TaxID=3089813 RepID=UPI0029D3E2FB|nr:hypothetical protein [Actinocorallia sp. A-T 12471]MDX6742529.1 hypothetical protein [Actinocorallia sp. A-T 12471]